MTRLPQKIFLIMFIFYILTFITFFIYSIFNYAGVNIIGETLTNQEAHSLNMDMSILRDKPESEIQILSNFKISWILSNSVRLFIQYLLPIQSTALIFSFSVYFPWKLGLQGLQIPFVDVIGKSIFLLLILTLFYSGLTEGLLPRTLKMQSEQQKLTEIAIDYFERAENELSSDKEEKDLKLIITSLKSYLQIDPGNPIVENTLDWAESTFEIKNKLTGTDENFNNKKIENGQEAADLTIKASDYFSDEDYFSALYYANLAFKLDASISDARRIAAGSREAIRSLEPDKSEIKAKEYFEKKRTGFELLNEGNSIDAYYIFKKLSVESNSDKDIPEFLDRSLEDISDKSFFIDEAEKYLSLPGIDNISFLNNASTLIYIEKVIILNESNAFFYNIEVIELNKTNEIIKHFSAKYGKYNSNSKSIIMKAIDRNYQNNSYKPIYYIGKESEPENIILRLSPSLIELKYLEHTLNTIKFMNILELFNYGSIFNTFGYIKEPAQILVLERIAKPFTFLIISFLSISLGWFLRIRKYTLPILALVLMPIIVYLINNILSVYEYGINLVLIYSLIKTGFYPAIIILIISQAVILFFSLVSIARQKN